MMPMVEADVEHDTTLSAPKRASRLEPGQVFAGRYEIEKLVGEGGMGAVYRAHDREVDETIALKLLLSSSSRGSEIVERFRREVRLARRVTHRNVARTYDLGEAEGLRFLTMEYVRGESLRQVLARKRQLTSGCASALAVEIFAGLAAAHEAGIIHRDLKPANILLERGGRVVITDFGIARATGGEATLRTGKLMGTPAYMSPEQVSGTPVDHRADVYAAGLILFEMLTGRLPFTGENAIAMALARLAQDPKDPRDFAAAVPAGLSELVVRMIARERDGRPATAAEAAHALVPYADAEQGGASPLTIASLTVGPLTSTTTTTPRWSVSGTGERALAVLPFRYRGPEGDRFVAEALTDELIDLLSRTRSLKVSGSGATAKYADTGGKDRDPRKIGQDLGVDVIVDGTVQLAGKRVRISARLEDVQSGFQLWSERFDGYLEDVFELQDRMGRRIAEALRVELSTIAHRGEAPAEAIELYLRARRLIRLLRRDEDPVELLERCLDLAPGFKPAIAAHAIACLFAWFSPDAGEVDWESKARHAVERALTEAPELAESHFASAKHAVQHGDFRTAARSLSRALKIAPTYAEAHDYLGRLQCEAGRAEQGIDHIRLAIDLDPTLVAGYFDIGRYYALRGNWKEFDDTVAEFQQKAPADSTASLLLELRMAGWRRDEARIRACIEHLKIVDNDRANRALWYLARGLQHDDITDELIEFLGVARDDGPKLNPRLVTVMFQMSAEVLAFQENYDRSMTFVTRAADEVLVDIDWIDRCPLLTPLRERPEFAAARQKVKARAEAIWSI